MIIVEEFEGDTLTPIGIFQRITGKKKILFESSLKHEQSGRYSFIGANPVMEIKGSDNTTIILTSGISETIKESPIEVLKKIIPKVEELKKINLPLIGGAIGFLGYDLIRSYEQIGEPLPDELGLPDIHFMLFEEIIVFDHILQKIYLVGTSYFSKKSIDDIQNNLKILKAELKSDDFKSMTKCKVSSFNASMSKIDFLGKVERAKSYIEAGDIFQVVLSNRMSATFSGDPFSFYRKLRIANPSPYMYYLDFEDYIVLGASPESLIKASDQTIITNPIAGTRPRGKTTEEDLRYEVELLEDEKELSEHRMLVDLGRNDVGKVSEFGSVRITKYMTIEKYKNVMHLVSEVRGRLKDNFSPLDALIAVLPAGTVSGAPKIRAMQIVNELEEVKRGLYSGAIGYLSLNGNMDLALAIRTMLVKDNKAFIQAGAGIVYDSIPEKEYEETLHKLAVFLEADLYDITH